MKLQKVLLLLTLIFMALMVNPIHAQTADEILADANAEAVMVISSGFVDALKVFGGVVIAVLILYAYALYRSSPPIVQELIIKNGDTVLERFSDFAEKTSNKIDDKLAQVATTVFHAVMGMLEAEAEQENDDTPPTPAPSDKTPVQ